MKQQFVITHTILQIENHALLDCSATNTLSVKMFFPQESCFFLYLVKNITCLIVGLLRIGQVPVSPVLCIGRLRQIAVS
jgi:hypothetical protein